MTHRGILRTWMRQQQSAAKIAANTQLTRADRLLDHFAERRLYEEQIDQLEEVLDEAQNGPPDGAADGSISWHRWNKLRALVTTARAFNDALKRAMEPDSGER